MATHHASPGERIDIRPLGDKLADAKTGTLFRTDAMEVLRLVLPAGKTVAEHKAPGEIAVQCIDNAVRQELVETMAFSPAHSLADHRPLGGLNTARSEIYKVLSQFRHQRNGKLAIEPTHELFNSLE